MKAITLKKNGGIENLTLVEIATPQIGQNEVLVKVKAISINPVDAYVRQSDRGLQNIVKPQNGEGDVILGWDISGTVVEKGADVVDFNEGDEVFGMVNFTGHGKAYAEYVAAPAAHLALKPENISHEEAAAATLAALTAYQALQLANVKAGEKVLIHAAGGGVGHYAVQIAKHIGAHVIGTASSSKLGFVLDLGADEVIDYKAGKFEDSVKDADVVIDSIPGDHLLRSLNAAKTGGRVVSIKAFFEGEIAEKAKEKNLTTHRLMVESNGNDMKEIAKLLKEGKVRSHVSGKFAFSDLPKAHQQIETGKTLGKIVVVL